LSEEYITSQTKYKWKCKICDEIWVASFNNIQKGSGCPYCSSFKSENEFREVIEKYFNAKFPKVRPRWLKNPQTNYCLELDGYNEELKIAFEYQGEQHFKVVGNNYFGDKEELVKRQKYDLIKKELCKEKNIILLCPTYELDKSEYKQFIKYHIK